MRIVAIVLALLAAAKIWTQEALYRQSTADALIAAYRERAIEACERTSARSQRGGKPQRPSFAKSSQIELVIGKSSVPVNVWDVDNVLWAMRFKYPYLVVAGSDGGRCSYDITLAQAEIV